MGLEKATLLLQTAGIPKVIMIKVIVDLMPLEDSAGETSVYFVFGESDKNKPSHEELKNEYGSIPRDGELDFLSNYEQLKINDFERRQQKLSLFFTFVVADANFSTIEICSFDGKVEIKLTVYFVCGESDKNKPSLEEIKNEYGNIPRDGELDFLSNYEQLKINNFERRAAEAFIVLYIRDDKKNGSVIIKKGRVRDIHHIGEVMTA